MLYTHTKPGIPRLPAGPIANVLRAAEASTPNRMTPGTYVRLRRQKAGCSIPDLARSVAAIPGDRALLEEEFHTIEHSLSACHHRRVAQMAERLDLDMAIYFALVGFAQNPATDMPAPRICTGCGCTWDRACADKSGLCAWRDGSADLCTSCPQPRKD